MEQAQRAGGGDAAWHAICVLLTSEYRNEIEMADQLLWECDSPPPPLEIDRIDGAISLLYSVTKIWNQLKSAMCELGGAEGVRDAFMCILVAIVADMLRRVASNTILDSDRATAVIKTSVWLAREVSHLSLSVAPIAGDGAMSMKIGSLSELARQVRDLGLPVPLCH